MAGVRLADARAPMDQAAAFQARDESAVWAAVDPRDQIRRLSDGRADRAWQGQAADPTGLDWTAKYQGTAAAFAKLKVKSAYIDGELCGVRPDGVTSFELMQTASDRGGDGLMFFAFDLLELDGENVARLSLGERKQSLKALLVEPPDGITFSDHEAVDGEDFERRRVSTGSKGSSPSGSTGPTCLTTVGHG